MIVRCKNCLPKEGIEIPDFGKSEKNKLVELNIQSPLRSMQFLIDHFNCSLEKAKYIVTHITQTYGHCNRCSFDQLEEEYVNCPKCKSLNFNWKIENGGSIKK